MKQKRHPKKIDISIRLEKKHLILETNLGINKVVELSEKGFDSPLDKLLEDLKERIYIKLFSGRFRDEVFSELTNAILTEEVEKELEATLKDNLLSEGLKKHYSDQLSEVTRSHAEQNPRLFFPLINTRENISADDREEVEFLSEKREFQIYLDFLKNGKHDKNWVRYLNLMAKYYPEWAENRTIKALFFENP